MTTPAAGANFSRTTGQGFFERILALFFVLTTSAAVANRTAAVEIQDADQNVLAGGAASVFQTASLAGRYYVAPAMNGSAATAPLRQGVSIPELFLQPGWRLVSNVAALDAADAITAIRGVVEQFGIGPDGTPVGETGRLYTERGRGYARGLESE